jgi:hypothetical protein
MFFINVSLLRIFLKRAFQRRKKDKEVLKKVEKKDRKMKESQ